MNKYGKYQTLYRRFCRMSDETRDNSNMLEIYGNSTESKCKELITEKGLCFDDNSDEDIIGYEKISMMLDLMGY